MRYISVEKIQAIYVLSVLIALAIGITGAYWDIQYHILVGRDYFWIPPHIPIYFSIGGTFAASVIMLFLLKKQGKKANKHMLPVFVIALTGLVQLLDGFFDSWWHNQYGLDATLWSPPHYILVLAGPWIAIWLLYYARLMDTRMIMGFGSSWSIPIVAMGITSLHILLAEFEFTRILSSSHISAARPGWLFLLIMLSSFMFWLFLLKKTSEDRWAATKAATIALLIRILGFGLLDPEGYPLLPYSLIVGAVLLDILYNHSYQLRIASYAAVPLAMLVFTQLQYPLMGINRFLVSFPSDIALVSGAAIAGILGYSLAAFIEKSARP